MIVVAARGTSGRLACKRRNRGSTTSPLPWPPSGERTIWSHCSQRWYREARSHAADESVRACPWLAGCWRSSFSSRRRCPEVRGPQTPHRYGMTGPLFMPRRTSGRSRYTVLTTCRARRGVRRHRSIHRSPATRARHRIHRTRHAPLRPAELRAARRHRMRAAMTQPRHLARAEPLALTW